ncbi:unnamed protein product [Clonostachys byssicola]|uniref:AB hydrolase-1 domain-containing protein n=1 Tax=Clonostachys byssicola TaxID=160290 RepID=A0A9N9UH40_9HYPO|nr:unnamed protein product [Clonostachys byssicola]
MTGSTVKFPTAEETLKHPAYPTTVWGLEPHQHGLFPAAKGRGGPINIAWEVHGSGPTKIVFIMGLAGAAFAWQCQTLYFGHDKGGQYSILVLDNRGIGGSDKPLLRYSTSEMALDVIEILDHLGWTKDDRQVHVAGISLGGMIAQEIAYKIPEKLGSLNLLCTTAEFKNATNYGDYFRERLFFLVPTSEEDNILGTARKCFPEEWLASPDECALPDPSTTPRCKPAPGTEDGKYLRFDSNYQRFMAQSLLKRRVPDFFTRQGFVCQLMAAGWHRKSEEQLRQIADTVGRDRIMVVHGTIDKMISPPNGERLVKIMEPTKSVVEEGMGHAPPLERAQWLNELLEERIRECEKL